MNEAGPATVRRPGADHVVRFYEDDEALSAAVAKFLCDGIQSGDSLVVIATQPHQEAFQRRLESLGVGVAALRDSGQLTLLDAHETLSRLMRNGEPDRDLFERSVGRIVADLSAGLSGRARLRAYGEMVDVLWSRGQRKAALQLEELWNELQGRYPFTLMCAYAMASFYKEPAELQQVAGAHTHAAGGGAADQGAQHLAREVARRQEVEQALRESLRELRAKEDQLRRSEEQLRDFVENATIGLHRAGPDGTILWANRAELELLGYTEEEYVGRPIADFHEDQDAIRDILDRLNRGEPVHDREARLRAKDGSIKQVLISSNVYSRDGRFIHTRSFTRDITERRKAQEALRQSEQQLQLVTDALPVLVALVDDRQRYRFASATYERWFGHPRAEIMGKHLEEVLGADAYRAIRPHVERALSGAPVTYEAELPYRDGGTRFVEATYIPQVGAGGAVTGFVSLVADITERKGFERFRGAAAARAERLLKITAAIADAVSSEQVFEALVDHVAEAVDASSAALFLADEDGRTARLARACGYSEEVKRNLAVLPVDLTPGLPALDCIRRREAIWISSQAELLEKYPHLGRVVTAGRSYRVACLPLLAHGRALGSLALTIEQAGDAGEEERDFLFLVARYAVQALERLRLLEAERRSRAEADAAAVRLGVLSHASRAFVEADLDLESRLRGIVLELGATLGSTMGITLLEPDGLLHTKALYHADPGAQEMLRALGEASPLRMGEGVTGTVAATGKSAIFPTIQPEEMAARAAPAYREFLTRYPTYAMLCAPLRARGRVIGTLTATRIRKGETYTPDDLQLFEELAERAAATIESSRLYQETLDSRSRAEQLYRFAQAAVAAEQVEQVYEAALASIEAALAARRSSILTFDRDGVMRFKAWHDLSDAYRKAVEGHSPWAADAVAPQPLLVPEPQTDPAMAAYLPLFRQEGIGALAFFPLVSGGRLIGKFMVYYDRPHQFAPHEVEAARAIANHLASVITRFAAVARLEETIRYNELFAGALAHDLRNPLGAIMTAAQLVLMRREGEGAGQARDAKPLSRILSSGRRMTTMIDQLLDLTRARAGGGIVVQPRETNLADLCAQAVGELELAYPDWNVLCEITGDQGGTWDTERLLQVISNLVANAGQHGSPGAGVMVRLDGTRPDQVTFEVHNEGAVPEALLPHLFDPFRSMRHRRDQSRGLGLGLFIVREVVRAHGGTVTVSSSESDGTTFTVTLPRRRGAQA